jgi:hypothetical protein
MIKRFICWLWGHDLWSTHRRNHCDRCGVRLYLDEGTVGEEIAALEKMANSK